jgi:hypothetical protein
VIDSAIGCEVDKGGNWTNTSQGIPLVTAHNGQQTTQTLTNQ